MCKHSQSEIDRYLINDYLAECRKTFTAFELACVCFLPLVPTRTRFRLAAAGSPGQGPSATSAAAGLLDDLEDASATDAASATEARFRWTAAEIPGEDPTTPRAAAGTLDEDDAATAVSVAGAGAAEANSPPGTECGMFETGPAATMAAAGSLDEVLAANAPSAAGAGAAEAPFASFADAEGEAGKGGRPALQ